VVEIREKKNVSSEEKRFEVKMGALSGVYIQILEFGIFTIGFCICITKLAICVIVLLLLL